MTKPHVCAEDKRAAIAHGRCAAVTGSQPLVNNDETAQPTVAPDSVSISELLAPGGTKGHTFAVRSMIV